MSEQPAPKRLADTMHSVEDVHRRLAKAKETLSELDEAVMKPNLGLAKKMAQNRNFGTYLRDRGGNSSDTVSEYLTDAVIARLPEIVAEVRQRIAAEEVQLRREALELAMEFAMRVTP